MKTKNRAIVLFSGGLDSTVALYWAVVARRYSVVPLTFNYSGRGRKESRAEKLITSSLGLDGIKIDVTFLQDIEDLGKQNKNPRLEKSPSAYIPSRNLIFYGIATSLAEVNDCRFIIGGHNWDDSASFPDSSLAFFNLFNKLTSMGLISGNRTGRVVLPFSRMSKAEVIRLGFKLDVPFEKTWSCYYDGATPCESCPACVLRGEAFQKAGREDPLIRKESKGYVRAGS